EDLGVVLRLDEAELTVAAALELVPAMVDLGRDPAHRRAVTPGQEILGLGVLEVRVLLPVEELTPLEDQRRDPRSAPVDAKGQLDELVELAPPLHWPNLDRAWHGCGSYT